MENNLKNQIVEILENANLLSGNKSLIDKLDLAPIVRVIHSLQTKDASTLVNALSEYSNCTHENALRKEQHEKLGQLARNFQQSLIQFRDCLGARIPANSSTHGNVQSQLESVMKMTHDSAMTVIQIAEKQEQSFEELKANAIEIHDMIKQDPSDSQVKQTFQRLSDQVGELSRSLENSNKQLLISQSYQDITGQVLQRIKIFVDSVEDGLIDIVKMLASDEIDTKLAEIDKEKLVNQCSQEDVDDLLSSLGF